MIDMLQALSAEDAASRLLGSVLIRKYQNEYLSGRIVETEAYHQDDPAAHSFSGQTKRNQSMFLPGGHAYIYISYGIHRCMNVVCGKTGQGEGVLIRALEPLEGIQTMQSLRGFDEKKVLTNGPGKLTQAMNITMSLNGHWLEDEPLQLRFNDALPEDKIQRTKRIGISKGIDKELRFYIKGNKYVSRP